MASRRSLEMPWSAALRQATGDEQLISIVADDVGRSIGVLLGCDFAARLRTEDFPFPVREGIARALRFAAPGADPTTDLW